MIRAISGGQHDQRTRATHFSMERSQEGKSTATVVFPMIKHERFCVRRKRHMRWQNALACIQKLSEKFGTGVRGHGSDNTTE